MGKIVKHCAACEESFAQKFGFCPNCGGALKAFEMNPIPEEPKAAVTDNKIDLAEVSESPKIIAPVKDSFSTQVIPSTEHYEISPKIQAPAATVVSANGNSANGTAANDIEPRPMKVVSEEPATKAAEISSTETLPANDSTVNKKPLAAAVAAGANGNGYQRQATNSNYQTSNNTHYDLADEGFHVTVIEEKNVGQRNLLLLGSMFLMLSLFVGGFLYSLFNKDMFIGAIDAGSPLYITPIEDVPMPVEEQPKPKIEKDAGGGGGGGNKNPDPVTKGEPPTQVDKPVAPLMMVPKMTNPDIKIVNQTQGTIKRPPTNEQVGLPIGITGDRLSSGSGSGGGFGNGRGSGAGNGLGTGEGNGSGSGSGNGNGNGNGNGRGDGFAGSAPPPPPKKPEPVGPTTGVVITAKPRAPYTDAARQNQFTGTVTLRVTFLASGQIGSISPISGQPYGLTEQAIAAARQIRFEPAKKNGVPQTVTKQVQYSFTLY